MWATIDSRDYILAFALHSRHDCPADFHLPPDLAGFEAGLFLPRDDPDWFGRSSYPPRLLLLEGGTLYIVPHPSTGEPPVKCRMDVISSVESGHMLLKGWLRFTGLEFDRTVPYNTRGFRAVSWFMRRFRCDLLPGSAAYPAPESHLGASLDIKFSNALAQELDGAENAAAQLFQRPREVKLKWWFPPRHRRLAGDLLVLTGRRLIWITDRERGSHSPYGSITSYAPLRTVSGMDVAPDGKGHVLRVDLTANRWRIPIAPEQLSAARDFATAAAISLERGTRDAIRRT